MNKIIFVLSVIAMIESYSLNPNGWYDNTETSTTSAPFDPSDWNKTGLVLDVPTDPPVSCGLNIPCGWGLYDRYSGIVSSYIQNRSCFCDEGTFCYRTKNDRVAASFIYLCRKEDPRIKGEYKPDKP